MLVLLCFLQNLSLLPLLACKDVHSTPDIARALVIIIREDLSLHIILFSFAPNFFFQISSVVANNQYSTQFSPVDWLVGSDPQPK